MGKVFWKEYLFFCTLHPLLTFTRAPHSCYLRRWDGILLLPGSPPLQAHPVLSSATSRNCPPTYTHTEEEEAKCPFLHAPFLLPLCGQVSQCCWLAAESSLAGGSRHCLKKRNSQLFALSPACLLLWFLNSSCSS